MSVFISPELNDKIKAMLPWDRESAERALAEFKDIRFPEIMIFLGSHRQIEGDTYYTIYGRWRITYVRQRAKNGQKIMIAFDIEHIDD